ALRIAFAGAPRPFREIMDNWKNVRLELAPNEEFPVGSVSRAYLIRLPLDDSDLVDLSALEEYPHRAIVRRFWSNEPDETGLVGQVSNPPTPQAGKRTVPLGLMTGGSASNALWTVAID